MKYKVVMDVAKSQYPKPLIKKRIEKTIESGDIIDAILGVRRIAFKEWDGITIISAEQI